MMDILDQYRNGDMSERISLFLSHRELREAFLDIDLSEAGAEDRDGAGPPCCCRRLRTLLRFGPRLG